MASLRPNTFRHMPINAPAVVMTSIVLALLLLAGAFCSGPPAAAQASPPRDATVTQVANDLYFFFDFSGSNSVFLVTEEGVLVIDTRTHPRDGRDLLDRIRKVTDKPIKWVINSHFHGDHHMGNSVFKALNATFVAHEETARLMQQVHSKEMARRVDGFKSRGYDPDEVKLVAPDVTFDSKMTIRLGGREIRLFYLGPGQQAGDTFVHLPHVRVLFTPGAFAKHSMPNMAFTPSVDNWIALLDRIAVMDVDTILPAHGDLARREDVRELAAMLADEYATVKDAASRGVDLDQAIKTLTFPQYKDWRNYGRLHGEIKALYELIQTGKRSYFD
ncbi:MAG TPA: MBL fold metallo-hydrolase [Xanthobacteraceae bacterium]|nr:MBL fold metallo-hydrolase [Xanthobacteraceae bacterium]